MNRWRRAALPRAAVAGALAAVLLTGAAPAHADVSYAEQGVLCTVTDSRLREISGLVENAPGALWAINDKAPAMIYRLDEACRIISTLTLNVPIRDTEDIALGPDGSWWVGDIGGNRFKRTTVSLIRRLPRGGVERYDLAYPDGPNDAEALLISKLGQIVVVTKRGDGKSKVYAAQLPLAASSTMVLLGHLDVGGLRPDATGSRAVTGGSVSPDGTHFVLRTYTAAYEWDAPDTDIVAALLDRRPRPVPLAPTLQGEAITYSADGGELLTGTERLPAPIHRVLITRPAAGS